MAQVITNTNLPEILAGDQPVMVDFWATWCGPCRILSPVVDEIADEFAGRAVVAKCNVDDADEVAAEYRVMTIPTLLFFKGGEMVDKKVGVVSKAEIEGILNSLL